MKLSSLLFLLFALHFSSFSQTINYSLPNDFSTTISEKDYKTIVDQSVLIVSKRYKIENVKNGAISVNSGQGQQLINLENLVSKCLNESDRSKWDSIIQDHFNALFNSIDQKNKMEVHNFESIKPYLSIRIYPNSTVQARGGTANLITRTDLEGTTTMLMLDLPQAFTNVLKPDFESWHKTIEEVFKAGLENINRQQMTKMTKAFTIDGVDIDFNFLENENYAASYALSLETNMPDMVGEWGSVVAIPNKGLVTICKISKTHPVEFVKFIQRIKPLIEQSYAQHPNPVSTAFFWLYQGKFTLIPVNTDDKGNINVIAPMGLSSLMAEQK